MLLAVKRVYVEPSGDRHLNRQSWELLSERLQSSGRFVVVQNPDDADALMRSSIKQRKGNVSLTIRLVDPEGKIIWPLTARKPGRRYSGQLQGVVGRALRDILDDIHRAEKRR